MRNGKYGPRKNIYIHTHRDRCIQIEMNIFIYQRLSYALGSWRENLRTGRQILENCGNPRNNRNIENIKREIKNQNTGWGDSS